VPARAQARARQRLVALRARRTLQGARQRRAGEEDGRRTRQDLDRRPGAAGVVAAVDVTRGFPPPASGASGGGGGEAGGAGGGGGGGRVASEASGVGGFSYSPGPAFAEQKRPPSLPPPRHSLREWGEGNPDIVRTPILSRWNRRSSASTTSAPWRRWTAACG